MTRVFSFLYGTFCYFVFLFSFLYSIGFVGNLIVPKSIDSGQEGPLYKSFLINIVLLGFFAVQHSVMARQGFKKWWTKIVPRQIERGTYVLVSSLLLLLLFFYWQPLIGLIWKIENPIGVILLQGLFWGGWLVVLVATFNINHFDLFGLRQVYLYLVGKNYTSIKFKTPALYKVIRHPIMLGFIIAFWATPQMTVGHLLFACATTAYIFIGIMFEERDLLKFYGDSYKQYQKQVSMLLPLPKNKC